MAGEQDGGLDTQVLQQRTKVNHLTGIKAGGRLIKYQDARRMHDGRRQSNALPISLGELPTQSVTNISDIAARQRTRHRIGTQRARHSVELSAEPHKFVDGEVWLHRTFLREVSDHAARLGGSCVHPQPCHGHFAGVGCNRAHQHPNGGGLAGAVWTKEPAHRTGRNGECHVIDGDHASKPLHDAVRFNHWVEGFRLGWNQAESIPEF